MNPPFRVYDTSGPYTDPEVAIDLEAGLPELRRPWIFERGAYDRVAPRRTNAPGLGMSPAPRSPARPGLRDADALREEGRDHARDGVRRDPRRRGAGARARRDRPGPGDPPGQHQPSGIGADGDRPEVPRQDQRQHRQLRRHLHDRRGSREDDLGDAVGRRHGHGPLDRPKHPRDAGVDPAQLAGADRDGADLPGPRESRRQGRGADVGDLPRHADRAGRAGCRLLHDPRRRAPAPTSR